MIVTPLPLVTVVLPAASVVVTFVTEIESLSATLNTLPFVAVSSDSVTLILLPAVTLLCAPPPIPEIYFVLESS